MNRAVFIRIGLALAVLAVYGQCVHYGFVDFDDPDYVRDNPFVKAGVTMQGIRWAFTTGFIANWHPITWLSLMLDAQVFGAQPWGFHVTNLVLHMANVLLLFGWLQRLTGATWRSALVAALFAAHPMHVESVAWISERKDVLSMLFGLLTLGAWLNFVKRREPRDYVVMLLWFALALMSKPMLVTLPCVMLLLDYWPLKRLESTVGQPRPLGSIIIEKLPLVALAGVSSLITWLVQVGGKTLQDGQWIPWSARLGNAAVSYVLYLEKLIWPVDLAALYPNPSFIGKPLWTPGQVGSAVALLLAITTVVAMLRRSRPWLLVGWLWFLGTLVPVIGLVQIGRHSMADRYAYLPYVGLYIAFAWELGAIAAANRKAVIPVAIVACAAIAGCLTLAVRQVQNWNDSIVLFEHALDVTEGNWLIHNNLAAMYERAGRPADAVAQMRRALDINPTCAWMWGALGGMHSRQRAWYEAQYAFEQQLKHAPNDAMAHRNLAAVLKERGRIDEATAELKKALEIDPRILDNPGPVR